MDMLSLYQSPVNCRSSKVEGTFSTKWITVTIFILQAWGLYSYLKEVKGLSAQGQVDGWILGIAYFLENYIQTDDW